MANEPTTTPEEDLAFIKDVDMHAYLSGYCINGPMDETTEQMDWQRHFIDKCYRLVWTGSWDGDSEPTGEPLPPPLPPPPPPLTNATHHQVLQVTSDSYSKSVALRRRNRCTISVPR